VLAEASAGISREVALETGHKYKQDEISDQEKNVVVLSGEDSLFQTFRRALAAFQSGYALPKTPPPPASFSVVANETNITLNWEIVDVSGINGFSLYRSAHLRENTPELIYEAGNDVRSFIDNTAEEGVPYYYYIESISPPILANPDLGIPAGPLTSGRYYTQTYHPAIVGPVGLHSEDGSTITEYALYQNYPNPFNPETTIKFDMPKASRVELEIFNLLGQKVQTVLNTWLPQGTHEVRFNAGNWASGTYIYVLKTPDYQESRKLILIK
jgi:hypothetical protein